MRKIIPIFLLSIFLFDLFGHFLLFKVAHFQIQKEMEALLEEGVAKEELFVMSIPVSDLNEIQWTEEAKEFRLGGIMFDVVRYEIENSVIRFYCVTDHQETRLFSHLENLIDRQLDHNKQPVSNGTIALLKIFCCSKNAPFETISVQNEPLQTLWDFEFSFAFSQVFIEIPTPPPNRVA